MKGEVKKSVNEVERKQNLMLAAEIIAKMTEKETETTTLVAQSMQLGYDIARAEIRPA